MQTDRARAILKDAKGVLAVLVIAAFVLGYLWGGSRSSLRQAREQGGAAQDQVELEGQTKLYVCPMMCVPPGEQPGNCPVCGMEKKLLVTETEASGPPRVKLSAEAVKLAEIQVAAVERKRVEAEVRLYGQIDYDPAHVNYVTAFMPGVIDTVFVKRVGEFVRWGEPLFSIYSSDLYATERELMDAMRLIPSFFAFRHGTLHVARETPVTGARVPKEGEDNSPEMQAAMKTIEAIRHKLSLLGMPKRDIDELMKVGAPTGIAKVYAPMYGQVVEQNAYEGTYVNTGKPIFTLADPKFVWVRLDAYEADYPWIRKGQRVVFQVDAYPGESFEAQVVTVDPVFNKKTRTFLIGAVCPETGGRLKAGMLVRSIIYAPLNAQGAIDGGGADGSVPLVIPAPAPLITGKRSVVYVALPDREGVFEGREVVLGPRAKDYYIVVGGLEEGERVVVNGNFKIDSAVQILAKSSMMSIEGGHSVTEHHHHGGSQVMHDHYWSERNRSRLEETEKPSSDGMPEAAMESKEGKPRDRLPRTIHRRRPGAYGDSTRPVPGGIRP